VEKERNDYIVKLEASGQKGADCTYDWYYVGTINKYHLISIDHDGTYEVVFKNIEGDNELDIDQNGIKVIAICEPFFNATKSIFLTAKMFLGAFTTYYWLPIIGSYPPPYMQEANVDFLREIGYVMDKRFIFKVEV